MIAHAQQPIVKPKPNPKLVSPYLTMTVDVEDWFHILDSSLVPDIAKWSQPESRIEANMNHLLELFEENGTRATFFWLGWVASKY